MMCSCFLNKFIGVLQMKKLKMTASKLTFEEGGNRNLEYCSYS